MKDDRDTDGAARGSSRKDAAPASSIGWLPYLTLCGVGVVLGLTSIGPSASEGLGTLNTMVFWAAHVAPAMALLAVTQVLLGRIGAVSTLPGLVQVLTSGVVASLLFAPIALGVDAIFAGPIAADSREEAFFVRLASEIAHFFVPLVLIWTLINAPSLLQLERTGAQKAKAGSPEHVTDTKTADDGEAEFWSRVPGRLGRRLVALSAELHYLRVHTTEGDTLILFPFGRAVDVLQDQNGMQVHRSHWVALDQIDEVVTQEGRTTCQMINGVVVPVSRSYRSALKAARRGGA